MPVIVITGASAGVGRATARRFARPGARIGLIARDRDRLERAADEVRAAGGEAMVLPLDVADADAVEDAADRIEAGVRADRHLDQRRHGHRAVAGRAR